MHYFITSTHLWLINISFIVFICSFPEPLIAQNDKHESPVEKSFEDHANKTKAKYHWDASNLKDHEIWQKTFGQKMKQLLGRMPERVPLEVKWTEEKKFEKFIRHKIYIRSESEYWVPVYYFIPLKIKRKKPAIVCLHGHSGIYPYIREGINETEKKKTKKLALDYAVYLAENGYVTAAIVVRGWNETAGYQDRGVKHIARSCHQITMNAFLLGMTPQGLRCWDAMRVIDFLETRDEVDAEKIGIAGLSGGGTLTTYLPILDERLKLVMIGGAFSSYRASIYSMNHCICNCLPGVMQYGEMSDVVALYAPKPVLLINGIQDPIFPIEDARIGFEKLKRVYTLLGKPKNIEADFFNGPHAWSNNKTLSFLQKHFGN